MEEINKIIAIKLTTKEADTLLQYLASKPYAEVVHIIDFIIKSEKVYEVTE